MQQDVTGAGRRRNVMCQFGYSTTDGRRLAPPAVAWLLVRLIAISRKASHLISAARSWRAPPLLVN